MPPKTTTATEEQIYRFLFSLRDLAPGGDTMPPTYVCVNKDHNPHHVAVGLKQKKEFNDQFKCKKWKPVKSS